MCPQVLVAQYSFFCGNQTMFDQASLTCTRPDEAVACEEAEAFYEISNDEFFKIDEGISTWIFQLAYANH